MTIQKHLLLHVHAFSSTSTKPQALNIVPSKVWLQRRLIGVKGAEEGLLTTAETERWILYTGEPIENPPFSFSSFSFYVVRLPISWTNATVHSRYLLFLWQLDRRWVCWPVHRTWRFCWSVPLRKTVTYILWKLKRDIRNDVFIHWATDLVQASLPCLLRCGGELR